MDELDESPPRVLAVVVSHNGRPWLGECLRSIAAQNYPYLDVIVVDSGSDPPLPRNLQRVLPNAEVLRVDRNVGFGAAANLALESSAIAREAAYFLFLHDDVAMDPDCVSRLVAAGIETDAAVVGGKGLAWDDPDLLLEVGMSADQFGYPFSGLEPGEIDQGQHDQRREVLFVTNACILLSRSLIERSGSWDGEYFAFGEDLDICLRARLAGFRVIVEPVARFRHAVALAFGHRQANPPASIRYLTRRNRLRTIAKTAAAYRMWAVMLLYGVLMGAEVMTLLALRRFEELGAYPRAIGAFLVSLPDVIRRRRAVQKRRRMADRRLRRLMVRDLHRARVFAERRLREWGGDTLRLGERTLTVLSPARLRELLGRWVRRPATVAGLILIAALLVAVRGFLLGEQQAAGGLWPFPEPTRRLIGDYFTPWRDVNLGSSSAAPPALVVMWGASLLATGKARLAQVILLLGLLGLGIAGMYRFAARRTSSGWARLFTMTVYAIGPLTMASVSQADIGALATFAMTPFLLEIGLRMLGPTPGSDGDRPAVPLTVDQMTQLAVRLGLATAVLIALAPSASLSVATLWILAGLFTVAVAWDRREAVRRAGWVLASMLVAVVLLAPWSFEAFRPSGAALWPISSGLGGGTYGPLWSQAGFRRLLLAWSDAPVIAMLIIPAIAAGAMLLAPASRRREARLLAVVWVAFGLLGGLASKGYIPAPVASPEMWTMVGFAAVAGMAVHFSAGTREELSQHVLGWRHAMTLVLVLALVAGIGISWVPQLRGWVRTPPTLAAAAGQLGRSISSFFVSTAARVGDFRILWLGDRWIDPIRSGTRRIDEAGYLLTGSEGLTILDAIEPPPAQAERKLTATIDALVGRRLHHAGHLLAPASIRYIVVDITDEPLMSAMRRQSDFALEHQQSGIAIFRNLKWLPRAGLSPIGLGQIGTGGVADERVLMIADWIGGRPVPRRGRASFAGELPRTFHSSILVGDNFHPGWRAEVGGVALEHSNAFGWANRFDLPPEVRGRVSVSFGGRGVRLAWVLLQGILVALAVAMARAGRAQSAGWLR